MLEHADKFKCPGQINVMLKCLPITEFTKCFRLQYVPLENTPVFNSRGLINIYRVVRAQQDQS